MIDYKDRRFHTNICEIHDIIIFFVEYINRTWKISRRIKHKSFYNIFILKNWYKYPWCWVKLREINVPVLNAHQWSIGNLSIFSQSRDLSAYIILIYWHLVCMIKDHKFLSNIISHFRLNIFKKIFIRKTPIFILYDICDCIFKTCRNKIRIKIKKFIFENFMQNFMILYRHNLFFLFYGCSKT